MVRGHDQMDSRRLHFVSIVVVMVAARRSAAVKNVAGDPMQGLHADISLATQGWIGVAVMCWFGTTNRSSTHSCLDSAILPKDEKLNFRLENLSLAFYAPFRPWVSRHKLIEERLVVPNQHITATPIHS